MKPLDFAGIYGTILCLVGAVIVVDHCQVRRAGFPAACELKSGTSCNAAVLPAWAVPAVGVLYLYCVQGVNSFFQPLPARLACGALYVVCAKLLNRSVPAPP